MTIEHEIYAGRDFLGLVRETSEGDFVAVIGENVIGGFSTIAEATDKILDLARPRAAP